MFFPEARVRVFVHGRPVDMRKSFTGLIALTKHALGQDPLSGHLYTSINRQLDVTELKLLLEGIEPARRRLRYRCSATGLGEVQ